MDHDPPALWRQILQRHGLRIAAATKGRPIEDTAILAGDATLARLVPDWPAPPGELTVRVISRDELKELLRRIPRTADWGAEVDAMKDRPGLLVLHDLLDLCETKTRTLGTLAALDAALVDPDAISVDDLLNYLALVYAEDGEPMDDTARAEMRARIEADKAGVVCAVAKGLAAGRAERGI